MNILINNEGLACLTDFGLSAFSDMGNHQFATARGGAEAWLPPETLFPEDSGLISDRQTAEGDIYSFACVCIEASDCVK